MNRLLLLFIIYDLHNFIQTLFKDLSGMSYNLLILATWA